MNLIELDSAAWIVLLLLELLVFLIIWYLKLQAYTNLLLTSTAFSALLHAITSLTATVTERIYKDLNLSRCQIPTFKTNVNENITSALRPTHCGLGCNINHSNLHSNFYSLTLHWCYSYVTTIISLTRTQSFAKGKPTTKYQKADLIQSLEATCFYVSRGSYTISLNNIRNLHTIISLILSSKLHKIYIQFI